MRGVDLRNKGGWTPLSRSSPVFVPIIPSNALHSECGFERASSGRHVFAVQTSGRPASAK